MGNEILEYSKSIMYNSNDRVRNYRYGRILWVGF